MGSNPLIGVLFHWLGGLASASFYLPYRGVRKWSWETYWLVGGVFSWIIAPWTLAYLLVPNLMSVLVSAPKSNLFWAFFFGLLWGVGGLTFGLTLRYLGIALGMAVALGYCAAFGTLLPPIFDGTFVSLLVTFSGRMILVGVLVCLAGIAVTGMAGVSKERELTGDEKKAIIKEFDFRKGMLVATVAGILSSCMAYGLAEGGPIAESARRQLLASGGSDLWQNLPVLIVVLLGGFTTNFIWCIRLNLRNKSSLEYVSIPPSAETDGKSPPSLASNYVFSALAGVIWYLQFFFYSMGTVRMGAYHFSSWTLHMASIIIFSTLWGIALKEWKNSSRRTWMFLLAGLLVLIASTVIVGYGNFLKAQTPG